MFSLGTLRLATGLGRGAIRARRRAGNGACHPVEHGTVSATGLDAPIEIIRDVHGVPHVFARSEADALFGQGYVHAQDRLFQMELLRRVAAGRLAELAGPQLVESDRFMRRLGLARRAAADIATAAADDLVLLEAYSRGVNAGIAGLPALPPEFALVDTSPEAWQPSDAMLLGRLLMFSFATNWESELVRDELREALGAERALLLDHVYDAHRTTHNGEPYPGGAERLRHAYHSAQRAGLPAGAASNAWAVSGVRSASGAPLVASDPHIETRLPGLFHVTHVQGGGIDAIGADAPGIPGIAIGHTNTLAWGLTAGMADTADCFVETVDPQRRDRYRTPEGWRTADRFTERIEVRGGEPIEEIALETRHGPVIEPPAPGSERAIALRCTALEPGDLASPFLGLLRAESLGELHAAIDDWHGTTFGFVYASVDGSIGHRMAGSVPRRAPGDGLLPTDGATSAGPAPLRGPRELPAIDDPPSGYVVAANNAPGTAATLGEDWCEPWRAERITELIKARAEHDVASFERIQMDRRSEALRRLRDLVVERIGAARDLEILRHWDGDLLPTSGAAALIEGIYREVTRDLVERTGGVAASGVLGPEPGGGTAPASFAYRMQGWVLDRLETPRLPWFADVEERNRAISGAVARALEALRSSQGVDPEGWAWGTQHRLNFEHAFGVIPLAGQTFSRGSRPAGGDVNTVWQVSTPVTAGPARQGVSPVYRHVIDLADFDRSSFQLPTGNSGIPGHPRYDDCIDEYLAGETRPLLYTRPAIEAAAEHRLAIEPAGAA